MSKPRPKTMADELRRAIRESGLTSYRIAKDGGTTPDQIDRFLAGRDIRISTAGKIARVLGLELRPISQTTKDRKSRSEPKP